MSRPLPGRQRTRPFVDGLLNLFRQKQASSTTVLVTATAAVTHFGSSETDHGAPVPRRSSLRLSRDSISLATSRIERHVHFDGLLDEISVGPSFQSQIHRAFPEHFDEQTDVEPSVIEKDPEEKRLDRLLIQAMETSSQSTCLDEVATFDRPAGRPQETEAGSDSFCGLGSIFVRAGHRVEKKRKSRTERKLRNLQRHPRSSFADILDRAIAKAQALSARTATSSGVANPDGGDSISDQTAMSPSVLRLMTDRMERDRSAYMHEPLAGLLAAAEQTAQARDEVLQQAMHEARSSQAANVEGAAAEQEVGPPRLSIVVQTVLDATSLGAPQPVSLSSSSSVYSRLVDGEAVESLLGQSPLSIAVDIPVLADTASNVSARSQALPTAAAISHPDSNMGGPTNSIISRHTISVTESQSDPEPTRARDSGVDLWTPEEIDYVRRGFRYLRRSTMSRGSSGVR